MSEPSEEAKNENNIPRSMPYFNPFHQDHNSVINRACTQRVFDHHETMWANHPNRATVISTVIDTQTGQMANGLSGGIRQLHNGGYSAGSAPGQNISRHDINLHSSLQDIASQQARSPWPMNNCGEFHAAQNLINQGGNFESMMYVSSNTWKKSSNAIEIKPLCENCKTWVKKSVDVKTNTEVCTRQELIRHGAMEEKYGGSLSKRIKMEDNKYVKTNRINQLNALVGVALHATAIASEFGKLDSKALFESLPTINESHSKSVRDTFSTLFALIPPNQR